MSGIENDIVRVPAPSARPSESALESESLPRPKSPLEQLVDKARAADGRLDRAIAKQIVEADLEQPSFSRTRLETIGAAKQAPNSTALGHAIIDSYVRIVESRFASVAKIDRKVSLSERAKEATHAPGAAILRLLGGKAPLPPPPRRELLPRADTQYGPLTWQDVLRAALDDFLTLRKPDKTEKALEQLALAYGAASKVERGDGSSSWTAIEVNADFAAHFNKVIAGDVDENAPWRTFRAWADEHYIARSANPWAKVYDTTKSS